MCNLWLRQLALVMLLLLLIEHLNILLPKDMPVLSRKCLELFLAHTKRLQHVVYVKRRLLLLLL